METPPPLKQLWTFITGGNHEKTSTANAETQTEDHGTVKYLTYNEKGELLNVIENVFPETHYDINKMLRLFTYSDDGCTETVNFHPIQAIETISDENLNFKKITINDCKYNHHSLSDCSVINSSSEDDSEQLFSSSLTSNSKCSTQPKVTNSSVDRINMFTNENKDICFVKYIPFKDSVNCFLQGTALDPRSRLHVIALQLQSSASCPNYDRQNFGKSLRQVLSDSAIYDSRKAEKCVSAPADVRCAQEEDVPLSDNSILKEIFYKYKAKLPNLHCQRFDYDHNISYINANIHTKRKLFASLYVQLPSKSSCFHMCNIKTELAVALMKAFLLPWNDCHLYWMSCLQSYLCEILKEIEISLVFPDQKLLESYEAVLILSYEATSFIRHKELYFLKALGAVLEADPERILLLRHKS